MVAELANLHLASDKASKLPGERKARGSDEKWFRDAVKDWTTKVNQDLADFSNKVT
ncbi:MAG: hypothetical protein ABIZ56_13065 [Chthoniobacteraceae bacterium]